MHASSFKHIYQLFITAFFGICYLAHGGAFHFWIWYPCMLVLLLLWCFSSVCPYTQAICSMHACLISDCDLDVLLQVLVFLPNLRSPNTSSIVTQRRQMATLQELMAQIDNVCHNSITILHLQLSVPRPIMVLMI